MKTWMVALVFVTGCAGLNPFGKTEQYRVTLSATGIVPVNAVGLGTIPLPENGEGLINLAVLLGGKYLAQEKNLKSCLFSSFPPVVENRKITATASAVCQLDGLPVSETIALTLEPVLAT